MSMFDTTGQTADGAARKENTLRKLERMNQALRHEEPDRMPISDFFWGGFVERWRREYFKPWVAQTVAYAHAHGLPVIYHGCGNVKAIFRDSIEMGVDAYHPLEAKAGMDAVELRRQYGHAIGFCGNSNIQVWETGDRDAIRREVLRKLNAAKGGGFIFQSDHSVSSAVSGHSYDYGVRLVREYGRYPIQLGDCEEPL